jgi:Asp-tRNA(Asn)/Glu-tRNA(Gln) amidotransferase A subunit family amidase
MLLARSLSGVDYVHAQRLRRRICENFAVAMRDVDVIATPCTAGTAPPLPAKALATGEANFRTLERMTRFASVSNLTGLPAISFPAGYDATGLPIGMQLIGPRWREDRLLRLAGIAECFTERRFPRVHYDLLGGEGSVDDQTSRSLGLGRNYSEPRR